jgi:hypothetical protein
LRHLLRKESKSRKTFSTGNYIIVIRNKVKLYICREGKNRNTLYFYSKHSGVMTWQAHVSGHAPSPPPTGRDESEDTQVELVLFEHSFEQVKTQSCSLFLLYLLFSTFWLIENKRTSSKPFHLMFYYFKPSVK